MPEDQRRQGGGSAGEGTTSSAETFPDALGRAIKVVRAGRDLGRRELAEAAGLSYSYLAEIENGTKQPSSRAILAIAEALGIPAHELMAAADTLSGPPPHEASATPLSWLARYSSGSTPPEDQVDFQAYVKSPSTGVSEGVGLDDDSTKAAALEPWPERPRPAAARTRGERPVSATPEDRGPSYGPPEELVDLFQCLAPDDQERLLDMARRLAGRRAR